mmetsp:Transcript_19164/g.28172  ORF Transcript_19164/g.28172 Transcript_19164/m.28172 type:complete len:256 (+) Transcript_19164:1115-1882(+)
MDSFFVAALFLLSLSLTEEEGGGAMLLLKLLEEGREGVSEKEETVFDAFAFFSIVLPFASSILSELVVNGVSLTSCILIYVAEPVFFVETTRALSLLPCCNPPIVPEEGGEGNMGGGVLSSRICCIFSQVMLPSSSINFPKVRFLIDAKPVSRQSIAPMKKVNICSSEMLVLSQAVANFFDTWKLFFFGEEGAVVSLSSSSSSFSSSSKLLLIISAKNNGLFSYFKEADEVETFSDSLPSLFFLANKKLFCTRGG